MITSVSTLAAGSGAATAVNTLKACIVLSSHFADIGQMTVNGGGGNHGRTHQMGAGTGTLRPSKLRLVLDAHRSPGDSTSSFIARHIEQPDWRHSKPACINIAANPSSSACARTWLEPGTIIART